jgi:hypothetical protein
VVRAGGGRGTKEEDALMEEGLVAHHNCLGLGAVDVPGGDADDQEVSGAMRSGSGEGAIITWLKIAGRRGLGCQSCWEEQTGQEGGEHCQGQ